MCCFVLSVVVAAATSFSPSLFSPPFLVNYDCMSRKKWQREMGGGMGGCGKMLAPFFFLPPSLGPVTKRVRSLSPLPPPPLSFTFSFSTSGSFHNADEAAALPIFTAAGFFLPILLA